MAATKHNEGGGGAIKLDESLLRRLDAVASKTGQSREATVAQAVREYLARHADGSLGTDKAVPPPKGG